MHVQVPAARPVTVRHELRPGDVGRIVALHGTTYAREYGFDHSFEAYVAGPLAAFACAPSPRHRIWIAERGDRLVGCIAIVDLGNGVAQLRWFLVDPSERGTGLGRRLLGEAVGFCRDAGYGSIVLWTVNALLAAAHLYRDAGFVKVEEHASRQWGVDVVEEKYERRL